MDNITHTLISALAADAAVRRVATAADDLPSEQRRALIVVVTAVGGNLPDLDFLYSMVTGSKLDYLLQHRGHTHTVVGALLASVLLWLGAKGFMRWRGWRASGRDRVLLGVATLAAPLLHIAMDSANNYGVHPFWPFDNRWYYGDAVFIIEPLLWAACAPLALLLRSVIARALVALVLAAGVALSFTSGLVPLPNAVVYTALLAGMLTLARRASANTALASGVALWLGVTFVFAGASAASERRTAVFAAAAFPTATLHDAVLTPSPLNPWCWDVTLVQQDGDALALRRAMLSLFPKLIAAANCPTRSLEGPMTAPVSPVAAADSAAVKWYGETISSIAELRARNGGDCRAAALLRFARAPWLARVKGQTVLGDSRYDREEELGFAEIDLDDPRLRCPALIPPWTPPRVELLR